MNKKISLLILLACTAATNSTVARSPDDRGSDTRAQTIPAQHIRALSQSISASGDAADIYYPALPKREQARYPLVIFLQGALVDKRYYSLFAQGLAQHGFVVVIPNHKSTLFSSNDLFMELNVITDTLAHMRAQTGSADSPLYQLVDTSRVALSGHSFGGLAALMAVGQLCMFPVCDPNEGFQRPPELKAAALVAAHAGILDLDTTGIPVALIVGAADSGTENFTGTYAKLEAPKALMFVAGANHFGLADINEPPGASIDPEDAAQVIPQSITAAQFAHWAGLYLRAHVKNDKYAWRQVYRSDGSDLVSVEAQVR